MQEFHNFYLGMKSKDIVLIVGGICCTIISIYQLIVLGLASFYSLFSIGMSLLLTIIYRKITKARLFDSWRMGHVLFFWSLLLLVSILIDHIGMQIGYWEYPHYEQTDQARKYLFEWTVALFYHLLAFLIGIHAFRKIGAEFPWATGLSLVIFVTAIGFITESLNLQVYSWRVTKMPFTNYQIGEYFLIFQTIGYWLMAIIPYALFWMINKLATRQQV